MRDNAMDLLKQTERRLLYKLPDFSAVDSAFVDSLVWPEGINVQMFLFDKPITGESELLPKIHSDRLVGIGYSYVPAAGDPAKEELPAGLSQVSLCLEDLRKMYYETQYAFYKKWEGQLGEEYMKETQMVIDTMLPAAKATALSKDGRNIALLTAVNWKDCFDQPADWITWVWMDPELTREERGRVQSCFLKWINENCETKVQCFVNCFNVKSQKFFRRLGFVPEWLHVVKKK